MTQPIIRCTDVAFPRFSAPDLDRMETFLTAFGMHRSARTADALYMRGTDGQHHVHVTQLGEPAFLGLAFHAASHDDLLRLATATGRSVEKLEEPGDGEAVRLTDPDGRMVDVVFGIETPAPLEVRMHPPLNTGAARVRAGELQRVAPGPSQVKRFGHAAIKTGDLARISGWYREHLGMLISDDFYVEGPERPLGRFMRCDRGERAVDHHTLLVLETGEVKLGHAAWEIADFDDLMVGHDHLQMTGQGRHYWGIGRHVLGGQIFDYWKDPNGFTVEHWTDSDLLPASVEPQSHHLLHALSQWGPQPPADLDF
ncbi:MAG TPA: VOC family protein [Candidatus Binatia bacterium]|nr:VOC family protein [Candidatus Binatia bacterium]